MIRKPVLALLTVLAVLLGGVVMSTPSGAVTDSATIIPSPNPGPRNPNADTLRSVSCMSSSWCVAVGDDNTGLGNETMVLMWDGSTWTPVTSPNPLARQSLLSVTCLTTSWCMAVGSKGSPADTFAVIWDGASWTETSVPITGTLGSVSCVSASSCVAVGSSGSFALNQTLILDWDGSTWTQATSPNVGADSNYLNSVSCVSASSCVAVGYYFSGGAHQTLAMVWNGTAWAIISSPSPGSGYFGNVLSSVSCRSATSCVAVGKYKSGSTFQTLVANWDGITWTQATSPNSGTKDNELTSVTCVSATTCVAVGSYQNDSSQGQTLVLDWDGSDWTRASSPSSPSPSATHLTSVSCADATSCFAVGYWFGPPFDSIAQTFTLLLAGHEPPATTTTSASVDPLAPAFTG